jgi:hypothetical protein
MDMGKRTLIVASVVTPVIAFLMVVGFAAMVTPIDAPCCGNVSANTMAPATPSQAPIVGEFTGSYVDGVPVYRLPPVTVSVSRNAELARMAQEEQPGRAAVAALSSLRRTRPDTR